MCVCYSLNMEVEQYQRHCDVHQKHCDRILSQYPGVTAVDVNYRQKDGKEMEERCIQVWVREKKHECDLPSHHILPREIDGCVVDIIEGEAILLGGRGVHMEKEPKVVKPLRPLDTLRGGDSIGVSTVGEAGTLGYFVRKGGDLGVVTNAHVVHRQDTTILSPSIVDKGVGEDMIGKTQTVLYNEEVDGAFVKLRSTMDTYRLKDGTAVVGSEAARVKDRYKFFGRTSGLSEGVVSSLMWTGRVGERIYRNQILLSGIVQHGDSGSLLVNRDSNRAIGLVFATISANGRGLANQIGPVLRDLDLTIAI